MGGFDFGTAAIYAIALLAIVRAALDRSLAAGDRALGFGAAACAMLLACPLISGEYAHRLSLMAFVPAALSAVLAFAPLARTPRGRWPGIAVAAATAALAVVPVVRGLSDAHASTRRGPDQLVKTPVIPDGSDAELISMRAVIADPDKTLVVARHGLQWWAGHFLHTPVRNSVPDDAFTKYDRVLQLVEIGGRGGAPGGFGGPPDGFGAGPPPRFDGDGPPAEAPRRQSLDTPMGRPRAGNVPREAERDEPVNARERRPMRRDARSVSSQQGTVVFESANFRLLELRRPTD